MGWKKKVTKTPSHTKQTVQDLKRRKVKMKKKQHKFILDQQGVNKPTTFSSTSKTRAENTLGHDPLVLKERELVLDLFGDDGESVKKMHTVSDEQEETQHPEVKVKIEEEDDPRPSTPDSMFDTQPQDEHEHKTPAWVDEDDHKIRVRDVVARMDKARGSRGMREVSQQQYSHTLQQKFNQTVGGTPDWARLHQPDQEEDMKDEGLVKGTGDYLAHGASIKLDKKRLGFKKQVDLNYASRTEGAIISATEFNPKHHMALVAGFSTSVVGAASLFKVDGTYNHLIHSIKFPKFPVKYAKFLCDGGKFVAGSNLHNHFYMYDLEAAQETKIPSNLGRDGHNMKDVVVSPDGELLVFIGKNGQLHLFDADCLSLVDTMYAPGDVVAATFNTTGSRLYTHTIEGDVCIWDVNARTCIHRFYDDGCIGGTSVAVSPSNQYLACGSSSGVVNVYDLADVMTHSPTPVKMLTRLRTSVSTLSFNSSSEILATVSDQMENAIKLVHLPSMTYFENFPDSRNELQRIHTTNFSPQSGFMAVGNDSCRAFLYRLHHFTSY